MKNNYKSTNDKSPMPQRSGMGFTMLLLLSSCLIIGNPAKAMNEEEKNSNTKQVFPPRPANFESDVMSSVGEGKKLPNNTRKTTHQTVVNTIDITQSLVATSADVLRTIKCNEQADNFEVLANGMKVCSGVGRIAWGGWNFYLTREKKHMGDIIRGGADLLSMATDHKTSHFRGIIEHEEEEKKKKDIEFKIHTQNNNENIENIKKTQEKTKKKIERANKLLKSKEEDTQKEALEMLMEAQREEAEEEKSIHFIKERNEKLNKDIVETNEKLSFAKQGLNNHDKGGYFIRVMGIFGDELIRKKDNPSIGDFAKAASKAMGKMVIIEPVRTAKYGTEVGQFFYSIYNEAKAPKEKEGKKE